MSDPTFNYLDQIFKLETEAEHLRETIQELREHIAVLEGDIADMRMVLGSPWWRRKTGGAS